MDEATKKWFNVIINKDIELIRKMIKDKYDIDIINKYGWTALIYLSRAGRKKDLKIVCSDGRRSRRAVGATRASSRRKAASNP